METLQKILLAEDEAIIALDIECDLEDLGVEVIGPCMSLSEALDAAKKSDIDGAILDIDLRGKEVFPVANTLANRGIPFVFHSGRNNGHDILKRFPMALFFVKPEQPSVMLKALQAMA